MSKLEYTSMGELVVFRITIRRPDLLFLSDVFPTHRKALNALRRDTAMPDDACIEPVQVFPGRFAYERPSPWAWVRP